MKSLGALLGVGNDTVRANTGKMSMVASGQWGINTRRRLLRAYSQGFYLMREITIKGESL